MTTIAAIATAPGAGGIGIVRLSGPRAKEILARLFLPLSAGFVNFRPWQMHHGRVLDSHGEALDDVLAVFMPGPRTFTGEDVAEIHCHGGVFIVQAVLESALRLGARQAQRGEFSRRAFCNGRMDLSQAEAVAELVAAPSREAVRFGLSRLDGLCGPCARSWTPCVPRCALPWIFPMRKWKACPRPPLPNVSALCVSPWMSCCGPSGGRVSCSRGRRSCWPERSMPASPA